MKKPESKSASPASRIDRALVEKAVDALLKHHAQEAEKNKSALLGTDLSVQLQFGLEVAPVQVNHKPIKLSIPHALWNHQQQDDEHIEVLEEPEVCLIVKEDAKPQIKELMEQFPKELCFVKKVLGLESLRKKHATYTQRRELLHKYNVFMADDRILPMLTTALGRDFLKAKQQPIPVKINSLNSLPLRLLTALRSTYLILSRGTCVTVKAGTTAMPRDALVDNLVALATTTPDKLPRQWANVRSMAIKTSKSTALPIYNQTPEQLMEIAKLAHLEPTFGETSKKRTKTDSDKSKDDDEKAKRRKLIKEKSPLVRAIQKAKQTENEEKKKTTPTSSKKNKRDTDEPVNEPPKKKKEESKKSNESKLVDGDISKKIKSNKIESSPAKKEKSLNEKDEIKTESTPSKKEKAPKDKKDKKTESTPSKKEQVVKEKKEVPKDTSFLPVKKFQGSKKGYVFQKGPKGTGYYKDTPPKVDPMAVQAIQRMGGSEGRQKKRQGGRDSSGSRRAGGNKTNGRGRGRNGRR